MTPELPHSDLSKIQALQQKRTLAFVNHFMMTNVQFLNNFMRQCEQKLMDFEKKLEKVDATMVLLEARLSSVPELNAQESPKPVQELQTNIEQSKDLPPETVEITNEESQNPAQDIPDTNKCRPEYDRFLKMVQVGVPVQAVKLKVSLEGLDPQVFEEILGK